MSSINKVILVGRLGHDPSMRTLPTGGDVCELSIATDHGKENERVTTWHKVIIYGRPGEAIGKLATKGSQVYAEGRISHRKYVGRDKVEKVAVEIIADRALLLGAKSERQDPPPPESGEPGKQTAADVAREAAKRNIKQPAFGELDDDAPPF